MSWRAELSLGVLQPLLGLLTRALGGLQLLGDLPLARLGRARNLRVGPGQDQHHHDERDELHDQRAVDREEPG